MVTYVHAFLPTCQAVGDDRSRPATNRVSKQRQIDHEHVVCLPLEPMPVHVKLTKFPGEKIIPERSGAANARTALLCKNIVLAGKRWRVEAQAFSKRRFAKVRLFPADEEQGDGGEREGGGAIGGRDTRRARGNAKEKRKAKAMAGGLFRGRAQAGRAAGAAYSCTLQRMGSNQNAWKQYWKQLDKKCPEQGSRMQSLGCGFLGMLESMVKQLFIKNSGNVRKLQVKSILSKKRKGQYRVERGNGEEKGKLKAARRKRGASSSNRSPKSASASLASLLAEQAKRKEEDESGDVPSHVFCKTVELAPDMKMVGCCLYIMEI